MSVEERIGPSTLILGEGGEQAIMSMIAPVEEAGFKAIEICPAQFQSVEPLTDPSLLKKLFGEAERRRLREALKPFHLVTVHGSSFWVTKIRGGYKKEEIWEPYRELISFAQDIGAQIVSFHPFQRSDGADISNAEMFEYNIEFGKKAVEYADERHLTFAFENMPGNGCWSLLEKINDIIDKIDSERFGFLFDIGHAVLQLGESSENTTPHVLKALERCIDSTFQIHSHGIQRTKDFEAGLRDHMPLNKSNILDYSKIMRMLKKNKFQGPIILEIYFENAFDRRASFQDNLKACISTKHELIRDWI
jgi:sugar phosphate isomerase/epimerase